MKPQQGYDFIGDVHGCAQTLRALLAQLGYVQATNKAGESVYEYHEGKSQRIVVFLGDLIDRGPRIVETVKLVKAMVEQGSAICLLGNHELHALMYAAKSRLDDSDLEIIYDISRYRTDAADSFLVSHNERRAAVLRDTLQQYQAVATELWESHLNWFATLPIYFEAAECRAAHACWHDELIRAFEAQYRSSAMSAKALIDMQDTTSLAYRTIDTLSRGVQLRLPGGHAMPSEFGGSRRRFRTRFWDTDAQSLADLALQPDPLPNQVAALEISDEQRKSLIHYPDDAPVLFIGHYWLEGSPKPLARNIICLDYSAVKGGKLAAYRFYFGEAIRQDHFVTQPNIE